MQKRTFISINPAKETLNIISDIQSMVRREVSNISESFKDQIKWEQPGNFHLTLFFNGDTGSVMLEKLDTSLSGITSGFDFEKANLKLKGLGAFPDLKNPRVIFVSLDNTDGRLSVIAERIKNEMVALGFAADKTFHPHITLGRVRRDRKIRLTELKNVRIDEHEFDVKSLCLMESRLMASGSEYSVLKEYGFGKAGTR